MASNNDISRLLLFGNILQHFPEFLIHLLPYIADRIVFNSIASCNRDTNEKSKVIIPPWPKDYKLPGSICSFIIVWSPDGTRVAYTCRADKTIGIVDQRYGIIHRINHNRGLDFCDFKFSPDGRFLVSVDEDGIVELWNNDAAGNYEQLQRLNIGEDVDESWLPCIDISACSKYIVVASYWRNRVVLLGVENGETIRSLTPQPVMMYINKVMFSLDCRAVFICGRCGNSSVIKLWRPYLDDTDENSLITLWEQKKLYNPETIFSHDKTMIIIQDTVDLSKGWLLSIDNNYSCLTQQLNFEGNDEQSLQLLQFTPDDECIIYATKNGLKYWSVAERKLTDNTKYMLYNKKTMMKNQYYAMNCSPNNRQLIVQDVIEEEEEEEKGCLYMKSIF